MNTSRLQQTLRTSCYSAILFSALVPLAAHAKSFSNSYVSFDLPDKWACSLEQTEWVCRPSSPQDAPLAIIILTAKEVGPSDNLDEYERYLKTPRQMPSRTGVVMNSQVVEVKQVKINDHMWVDGMHESSEVANYYTRYLATKEDKIAVAVTFSAHKQYYTKFSQDFIRAIQSLKVIASKSLMSSLSHPDGDGGEGKFGVGGMDPNMGDVEAPTEGDQAAAQGISKSKAIFGLALLIAVIAAFLLLKGKGKKKSRSRK